MRVYVYVDGFNLFYRALNGKPCRWLDLAALAQRLLQDGDTVEKVRYFTARVKARSGHADAPRKQQLYFNALKTLPCITIHYGHFMTKVKMRPLDATPSKFVAIRDTEEKGSDVNLAVHLVNDAWHKRFDLALVMSQDSDLVEPLKIVNQELGLRVGLVWLDGGKPNRDMAAASSFVRHISQADLTASQFADKLPHPQGGTIDKPAGW